MLWRRLRNFQFDWKLTLLVLVLLPIMLRLGFWQLAREAEKEQLQAVYTERQQQPAVPLETLDASGELQYLQVLLVGEYDSAHVFLLDNKIFQGQVGFEVIQPFTTDSGLVVFVNRGWLAQAGDRSVLPQVDAIEGKVALHGSVYVPVGEQLILGDIQPGTQWPKIVQSLEIDEFAQLTGLTANTTLFPYSIRLGEGATGVLERNWSVISTTPEKHRGYAVQWFAMAIALILLYLHYSFRPARNKVADTDSSADNQ